MDVIALANETTSLDYLVLLVLAILFITPLVIVMALEWRSNG